MCCSVPRVKFAARVQGHLTQLVMAAEGSTPSRMNREGAARTYSLYQWASTCSRASRLDVLLMVQKKQDMPLHRLTTGVKFSVAAGAYRVSCYLSNGSRHAIKQVHWALVLGPDNESPPTRRRTTMQCPFSTEPPQTTTIPAMPAGRGATSSGACSCGARQTTETAAASRRRRQTAQSGATSPSRTPATGRPAQSGGEALCWQASCLCCSAHRGRISESQPDSKLTLLYLRFFENVPDELSKMRTPEAETCADRHLRRGTIPIRAWQHIAHLVLYCVLSSTWV